MEAAQGLRKTPRYDAEYSEPRLNSKQDSCIAVELEFEYFEW